MSCMADVREVQEANDKSKFHRQIRRRLSCCCWCCQGNVGINTESPDEALTVVGNVKLTGHVFAPSDVRVKTDIHEVNIVHTSTSRFCFLIHGRFPSVNNCLCIPSRAARSSSKWHSCVV